MRVSAFEGQIVTFMPATDAYNSRNGTFASVFKAGTEVSLDFIPLQTLKTAHFFLFSSKPPPINPQQILLYLRELPSSFPLSFQCFGSKMKANWQEEELLTWTRTLTSSPVLLLLWGYAFRVIRLWLGGYLASDLAIGFSVLLLVCLAEHQFTARTSSFAVKCVGCYVYLELIQVCFALLAIYADHDYSVHHALMATMICLTYQVSLHMTTRLMVFFMCKHFALWLFVGYMSEISLEKQYFPYMTFCMILFLTLKEQKHRQQLAKERTEVCNSLVLQEKRLHTILTAVPDGLVVFTASLEVKQWNEALLYLLDLSTAPKTEEAIQACCKDLRYVDGMKKVEWEGEELGKHAVALALGNMMPCTLGTTLVADRYLEWKGSCSTWGQEKVCILTVRDSTNWIHMQDQIQRESASKTALLRSVSHELRTPTNAVINLVKDVLEEETLSSKSTEDLCLVSTCSHFLLSMINDLLDFSKLIAGKFALVKTNFPLRRTLQQSVQLFEPQCRAKGIGLHLNIDPLLADEVYTDPNRFKQVLLNLLSNAIKFTMKGYIRVMVMCTASGQLKVAVQDTGIGIAKSKQKKLFKLFGKLKGNEGLNPQGSGLGLNIANALALELGGKSISLQSEEGQGATFSFFTNISEKASEISPSSCSKFSDIPEEITGYIDVPKLLKSEHCFARQQPMASILIVDDAEFNRLVLHRMLKSLGWEVDEAVTGLHALTQIQKAYQEFGHVYKLVLMDLEMPEIDGFTAIREIQSLVDRGDLPVAPIFIACSAYSSPEDKELCSQAGLSAYLEKPVSKESLTTVISNFL